MGPAPLCAARFPCHSCCFPLFYTYIHCLSTVHCPYHLLSIHWLASRIQSASSAPGLRHPPSSGHHSGPLPRPLLAISHPLLGHRCPNRFLWLLTLVFESSTISLPQSGQLWAAQPYPIILVCGPLADSPTIIWAKAQTFSVGRSTFPNHIMGRWRILPPSSVGRRCLHHFLSCIAHHSPLD
jgi:hypothetical protein